MEVNPYITTVYRYTSSEAGKTVSDFHSQLKMVSNSSVMAARREFNRIVACYKDSGLIIGKVRNKQSLHNNLFAVKNLIKHELLIHISNINGYNRNIHHHLLNKSLNQRYAAELLALPADRPVRIKNDSLLASDGRLMHQLKNVFSASYHRTLSEAQSRFKTTRQDAIRSQLTTQMEVIQDDIRRLNNQIEFNMKKIIEKNQHLQSLKHIRQAFDIYDAGVAPVTDSAEHRRQ